MILDLASIRMGVGGCFCSTVQKQSNKVQTSVIKRDSHSSGGGGGGGGIKASCSESMHFCLIEESHIHIGCFEGK